MIEVLFFGRMADVAGTRRTAMDYRDGLRLAQVRDAVLPDAQGVRMSVNKVQVPDDIVLSDGDEVAFFSVFSGG